MNKIYILGSKIDHRRRGVNMFKSLTTVDEHRFSFRRESRMPSSLNIRKLAHKKSGSWNSTFEMEHGYITMSPNGFIATKKKR